LDKLFSIHFIVKGRRTEMPTRIEPRGTGLHVYLEGEIDHHTAAGIRERVDEAISRQRPKILCLDFADVTFMDSSGVGLVMGRYRALNPLGGKLELRNLSPTAYKVMRLSGLDRLAKLSLQEVRTK
jgi:stage II sporulation protein AA (anti-sigma F factor antagonist)